MNKILYLSTLLVTIIFYGCATSGPGINNIKAELPNSPSTSEIKKDQILEEDSTVAQLGITNGCEVTVILAHSPFPTNPNPVSGRLSTRKSGSQDLSEILHVIFLYSMWIAGLSLGL